MVREEVCKTGFTGVRDGLMAHGIGLPPIIHHASSRLKSHGCTKIIVGSENNLYSYLGAKCRIGCIKYNNKGGSWWSWFYCKWWKDLNIQWVQGGLLYDCCLNRRRKKRGLSLLLIPKEIRGLTQTSLKKSGWWTSDIATLHFDNCRVRAINLVAQKNYGFQAMIENLNLQRLV